MQLAANFGKGLESKQIGRCMATRDREGPVADGVEVDSVADLSGEAEKRGESLVAFGAVRVGVSSSESVGRGGLTCEALDRTSGGGVRVDW